MGNNIYKDKFIPSRSCLFSLYPAPVKPCSSEQGFTGAPKYLPQGKPHVLTWGAGFTFSESFRGLHAESPRNNSYSFLLRIDVATWEGAHFYHLTLLHLVHTYRINTFDFTRTIGQRCTAYTTGIKVFNLVEAKLQYLTRR